MDRGNDSASFKRSFRGYNTAEVDEYVETVKKDMDTLRAELADVYKKYSDASAIVEKYRREEAVRGDIIKGANEKADDIVNDAKSRAARVIAKKPTTILHLVIAEVISCISGLDLHPGRHHSPICFHDYAINNAFCKACASRLCWKFIVSAFPPLHPMKIQKIHLFPYWIHK